MTDSDPSAEPTDLGDDRSVAGSTADSEHRDPAPTTSDAQSFGWRGWVLLGIVLVSFFVTPGVILWRPPMLPRWVALVAFPMLPGLLLGGAAVWAALRG